MNTLKKMMSLDNTLLKYLLLEEEKDVWVNPIYSERAEKGEFHVLFKELLKQPVKFFEYTRMTPDTFFYILEGIKEDIEKWSNFRKCISPEERLLVTLRFLSTGMTYRSLAFSYRIPHNTLSGIIYETCEAIWKKFTPVHLPFPTRDMWLAIADEFQKTWNFPHCIGCIDGKHVRIRCPKKSGSLYYNYKQYFSIQLQAVADAKYKFICIDVGSYGRHSDSGIFAGSSIHRCLEERTFNVPEAREIVNTNVCVPYVLLGDQGYPLKPYLLRPYSSHNIDNEKEVFNYRLCRARRTVECAFGILVAKWRCLKTELQIDPNHVDTIVKCACVLHNIVMDREGPEEKAFSSGSEAQVRHTNQPTRRNNRSSRECYATRDAFKEYFNGSGAVSFQYNRQK